MTKAERRERKQRKIALLNVTRRHHNTKGYRQIKAGKTSRQVDAMAKRFFEDFGKEER